MGRVQNWSTCINDPCGCQYLNGKMDMLVSSLSVRGVSPSQNSFSVIESYPTPCES